MIFFFFNDTATTEIYTLSLHDALPISVGLGVLLSKWSGAKSDSTFVAQNQPVPPGGAAAPASQPPPQSAPLTKPKDRKSTRLNSSHSQISYAVFCLKKKKKI